MKEVSVNFKNCFGIKKLEHTFSFENKDGRKVFAIYARNGLMKTSFAKTCQKISQGKKGEREIKDVIFNNKGTADIKIDGKAIKKDQLFVIRSFQESYESDVSSLLLDSEIKEELTNLMALKDKFLEFLEEKSGLKRKKTKSGKPIHELLENIKSDFAEESILQTIPKFKEGINSKKYDFISNPDRKYSDIKYSDIKYSDIFDETTLKKIKSDEFQKGIDNFIKSSKKIYEEFGFLEKGKFTYPKLLQIQTSLEQNNFFIKGNIIELAGKKITSEEALEKQINKIKDKIKEMPEYKKIEDLLEDAKGRKLKDALELYPEIIEYLSKDKLKKLKKALWIRYCKEYEDFKKLCDEYEKFNKKYDEVNKEGTKWKGEGTKWKKALKVFKARFNVPFEMNIENLKSAIIGEMVPEVKFKFNDKENFSRSELDKLDTLSRGEQRALYLLNIIFEIEKLKTEDKEKLIIIDDIADSFDYKNKYAIIEYLYELSKEEKFYMIILSHNFDFYRTVSSRLGLQRQYRLMAEKQGDEIKLKEEKYQNNPFEHWRKNGKKNEKYILALIPFVRNLIEYTNGDVKSNDEYNLLTSLLHQKKETKNFTYSAIESIYKECLCMKNFNKNILSKKIIKRLYEKCNDILKLENVELEDKIILSMGIRLKAEEYMIFKIKDKKFLESIKNNQTRELFNKFNEVCKNEAKKETLRKVLVMTPEFIHINSFMYEPLIDMDIIELRDLYKKVDELNNTQPT